MGPPSPPAVIQNNMGFVSDDLVGTLPQSTILTVTITATSTQGSKLTDDELRRVLEVTRPAPACPPPPRRADAAAGVRHGAGAERCQDEDL